MTPELKDKIARLKELAGKATQGAFVDKTICMCQNELFANYISAANPATILELIDEIENLEKEADWLAAQLADASRMIIDLPSCKVDKEYWLIRAWEAVGEGEMIQELKPCPFCGNNDIRCFYNEREDTYFVFCNECGVRTAKYPLEEKAIQAWNRREDK